jgi:pantothenate kinase-related protein Tda10
MLSMQMEKESMQNRKPMILVLAGPNGSGESTITTFLIKLVNIRMRMMLLRLQE